MNQKGWFLITDTGKVVNGVGFRAMIVENRGHRNRVSIIAGIILIELHNRRLTIREIGRVVIKILLNYGCKNRN